jgi:hypothetical protein
MASMPNKMRLLGAMAILAVNGVALEARAGTAVLTPVEDTFINSVNPNNNNGGSSSVFTGTDGQGGLMRGLLRFDMPASWQGRAVVSAAQLKLTLRALPNGTAGTPAIETLQALSQPWTEGNGSSESPGGYTVGLTCDGTIFGATWTQTNCATSTSWTTPGGSVAAAVSATADTTGVPVGGQVTWSSGAMNADVQGWIDAPSSNDGWRIMSSTEGMSGKIARFYSKEAGASAPSLTVSYTCPSGFADTGTSCTTCTSAANAACVTAQGNACVDSGPPVTSYTCACTNAAYKPGSGGTSCVLASAPVPTVGPPGRALLGLALGAAALAALSRARSGRRGNGGRRSWWRRCRTC